MLKYKRILVLCLVLLMQLPAWAQNNTNSPYTRFGYGSLADRSFGAGRAMGGLGIGLRSSKQINPLNPATYSAMDSLTFMFDVGATAHMSWFDDGQSQQKDLSGNIEYIAMQFPFSRRLAMSAGLLPYSHVGYRFGGAQESAGVAYSEVFAGKGSLTDLYVGLAYDIWKKRLSVGANLGFMFGSIMHERNLTVEQGYSVYRYQKISARDIKLDFGVQYVHPFSKTENMTFGFTFRPKQRLSAEATDITVLSGQTGGSDPERADTISSQEFNLPLTLGFGLSYNKINKLTIGADVQYEQWSNAKYYDKDNQFDDRLRLAVGLDYVPKERAKNIFSRAHYRAGLKYSNSYVGVKGNGYDEYGVSVGLGLPLVDNRSFINLSFEYNKVKPSAISMIDEQYFRFTVNYTFNEMWFYKLKID